MAAQTILSDTYITQSILSNASVLGAFSPLRTMADAYFSSATAKKPGCAKCGKTAPNMKIIADVRNYIMALPPSDLARLKKMLNITSPLIAVVSSPTGTLKISL